VIGRVAEGSRSPGSKKTSDESPRIALGVVTSASHPGHETLSRPCVHAVTAPTKDRGRIERPSKMTCRLLTSASVRPPGGASVVDINRNVRPNAGPWRQVLEVAADRHWRRRRRCRILRPQVRCHGITGATASRGAAADGIRDGATSPTQQPVASRGRWSARGARTAGSRLPRRGKARGRCVAGELVRERLGWWPEADWEHQVLDRI